MPVLLAATGLMVETAGVQSTAKPTHIAYSNNQSYKDVFSTAGLLAVHRTTRLLRNDR
jgi:hypothetical protein